MVIAIDYKEDILLWGKVERFHAVEYCGSHFRLNEPVCITTKDELSFAGAITGINHNSLDFMTNDRHFKLIYFDEITDIHY